MLCPCSYSSEAVGKTACLDPCPDGAYGVGTGETGRTCVACDITDCGQCSEAGKCDECENSKYLVVGKTACPATCPAQFYGAGSGEKGRVCKAKATCGNADTASATASPVSDADCGAGFIADPDTQSATLLCAGGACDPTNVAADKAACCVALSTCGDKNGAAAGTDAVSDSDCGDGAVYKIESASTTCRTFMCDVSSTVDFEGDKASCCMKVGTCSSVTDSMCGNGFIYNIANPKVGCAGATCDPINVPADKTACCVPQATCGTKPVTNDDCGANFAFKGTNSSASLCVGAACSPVTVTEDRDACCVAENCVVGSTWSTAGTAPCAVCKKAADCVHDVASACDATTDLVCKNPPVRCVAGSTWSDTGAAPCAPCKQTSTCPHGLSSGCDPENDLICKAPPAACVSGSTYSASGVAPCAVCRNAADCVHGTRAVCDTVSNLVCKVPPPAAACVAGSTWSPTSKAPCATCKQASECDHGVTSRCDPGNDLVCDAPPSPCVAGSTYSASGTAPCGDCKASSECIHGTASLCNVTKNRVCAAQGQDTIVEDTGGGGSGTVKNDTEVAVVPTSTTPTDDNTKAGLSRCSGTPFDWPCWWWIVALFLIILLILLIICCCCCCCPCCLLAQRRHRKKSHAINDIIVAGGNVELGSVGSGAGDKTRLVAVSGDGVSLSVAGESPINYKENPYQGWDALPMPDAAKPEKAKYEIKTTTFGSTEAAMVISPRGGRVSQDFEDSLDGDDDGKRASVSAAIDIALVEEGGWIKVLDPETGRPFYFNEATGASLWHAPKEGFEDATKTDFSKQRRKAMSPKKQYRVTEQEI